MENHSISKQTITYGLSAGVCALLNAFLVVAKEKSIAVQGWMQKMTGHHWVTHMVIIFGAFLLLGLILGRMNGGLGPQVTVRGVRKFMTGGVVGGVALVLGFYLFAN